MPTGSRAKGLEMAAIRAVHRTKSLHDGFWARVSWCVDGARGGCQVWRSDYWHSRPQSPHSTSQYRKASVDPLHLRLNVLPGLLSRDQGQEWDMAGFGIHLRSQLATPAPAVPVVLVRTPNSSKDSWHAKHDNMGCEWGHQSRAHAQACQCPDSWVPSDTLETMNSISWDVCWGEVNGTTDACLLRLNYFNYRTTCWDNGGSTTHCHRNLQLGPKLCESN
mmetsp:Transcript_108462/g.187403  ORF Transcript_108462/g.187403 Transcript_108462/m.187403 type:complete len:220 (+) Transcript_108462:558-1217(+)